MVYRNPRTQFREEQAQRANDSPTLAAKFPKLKSLSAVLEFCEADKASVNRRIKYKLNPQVAKSVFRFSCPDADCIRGGFELSDVLASAIAKREKKVEGEMACPGGHKNAASCRGILRYQLVLVY